MVGTRQLDTVVLDFREISVLRIEESSLKEVLERHNEE